jgi:hypothetical protein
MPENKVKPAGFMIERNPGVALVWVTKQYEVMASAIEGRRGALLHIGEPTEQTWWCRGRRATLDEVMASIEGGLPQLREIARQYDGADGAAELEVTIAQTIKSIQEQPWPLAH